MSRMSTKAPEAHSVGSGAKYIQAARAMIFNDRLPRSITVQQLPAYKLKCLMYPYQEFALEDSDDPDPFGRGYSFAQQILKASVEASGPKFVIVSGAGISVSCGIRVRRVTAPRSAR